MTPVALTIAGSDPSGGAGIQADLKTFHQYGVYGTSVLTLLTVQNTCRVSSVEHLRPEFVLAQLDAVLEDLPPRQPRPAPSARWRSLRQSRKERLNSPFPWWWTRS